MTDHIAIDHIRANPWQTRLADDPEHIQRLADDIAANGLLQTPLARAVNGHYELAFGHSRLAAWKIAKPQEPFPLDVKPLSDRQLSDFAASENAQRRNLSAIETAIAIDRRIRDFKLTQLEAAKPFGIESQGGVSNLLRLLKLPEPVRALVQAGKLPERHARQLIPLAKANPEGSAKVASQIAGAAEGKRDSVAESELRLAYQKWGQSLSNAPWGKEWPPKPIDASAVARSDKGEPASVPSCAGCEFHVKTYEYDAGHCLRRPCYNLKARVFADAEVERIAVEHGIPAAAAGETWAMVYDGKAQGSHDPEKVAVILKSKHPSLRIVPFKDYDSEWQRNRALGSKMVALASVDLPTLERSVTTVKQIVARPSTASAAAAAADEADSRRRRAQEAQDRQTNRALVLAAAQEIARQIKIDKPILSLLFTFIDSGNTGESVEDITGSPYISDEIFAALKPAKQRQLFVCAILEDRLDFDDSPDDAHKAICEVAKTLKVKLPKGWDAGIEGEPAPAAAPKAASKSKKK